MSDRNTVEQYCSILNTDVLIELGYATINNYDRVVNSFDCRNACVECGVITNNQANNIRDWSVCPIYDKYT